MMNGIEVKNLTKQFGQVTAVDNITLTFEPGRIYGLLGRNGAGKSTLLNIISNRIFPGSGEVLIDGERARENDKALGKLYLMSEKNYYPENMKIDEIFRWTKTFYPDFDRDCAYELARQFGLATNKSVRTLSTGYASIFKLIIALSVQTPYVMLDEPVLGLDANHRSLFYRILIEQYSKNPRTIILSTHLIEEVASVIEDVIIIKGGKLLKNESCESLLSSGYTVAGAQKNVDAFIQDKNIIGADNLGGLKTAYILGPRPQNLPEGLEITRLDLQKLFIQLTDA